MQEGIIVLSTYPDEQTAAEKARSIVEAKLAACVNLSNIRSFYWWEGKIEDSRECLAIFKSTTGMVEDLKKAIAESHPYEVPEIVTIRMNDVGKPYLDWMISSTA